MHGFRAASRAPRHLPFELNIIVIVPARSRNRFNACRSCTSATKIDLHPNTPISATQRLMVPKKNRLCLAMVSLAVASVLSVVSVAPR